MTINTQKLRAYRQSLKRGVSNTGHGHVFMRPDGLLARCGGPALCAECAKDLALLMSTEGYEPPTTDDLVDTIDAQAAEIARLKAAQAWQPIETAPQGQIALFYDANATEVRGCMFVDWMVDGAFCGNRHHVATHWMSLPAAPSALSGDHR